VKEAFWSGDLKRYLIGHCFGCAASDPDLQPDRYERRDNDLLR
jgi:hypothetical protein